MSQENTNQDISVRKSSNNIEESCIDKEQFERQSQTLHQSFDDILTKIGFGKYTMEIFILMGLIGMTDGAEALNLSLVLPIMEKPDVWGIKDHQEALLGSLVFSGYFLGSLVSGKVADTFGRKKAIQYPSILLFIFAISSGFSLNYGFFVAIRTIFGILVGFIVPVSFSILAENIPVKQRGFMLVFIGLFYTLGELFACLLALITMDNLTSGNWRLMLVLNSIPAFLLCIGGFLFLQESPRFLAIKEQYSECFSILDKMSKINNNKYRLTEQDEEDIKIWANESNQQVQDKGELKSLFQGKFVYATPIIWYNWFVSSFVFFGISFLLPLTLKDRNDGESQDDDESLLTITISSLGELPTLFLVAIAVHVPYLGRKNTWGISYALGFITLILVYFEVSFTFFITVSKLALDMAFTLSYEYTGEIYPTKHRATGLGMAGAFSRIGGIIMPWVGIYISKIGLYLPYLIFGISSGIAAVVTFMLPFETRNQDLDRFQ